MQLEQQSKFLVLTTQRSGSTWLMSILNQDDNITAYNELFLERKTTVKKKYLSTDLSYPRFIEFKSPGLGFRASSIFAYLDQLYQQSGTVGFKLMYSQVKQYPEILAYLMRHRLLIVHLVRQNYLDVVISRKFKEKIKAQIGYAHLLSGQPKPEKVQIELEPQELLKRLQYLQKNYNLMARILRWLRLPHIEITYEQLLQDPANFHLIWNFLGISCLPSTPQSNLVKMRQEGHAEVISNYDEVKKVLANSPFATLLD